MSDVSNGVALAVTYPVSEIDIGGMREKFTGLSCATTSGYEEVRVAIRQCVGARSLIEKTRKNLKADALEYGRRVDSIARTLTNMIEEFELPLQAQKDAVDNAARMAEEAEARRIEEARQAEIERRRAEEQAELERQRAEIVADRKRMEAEMEAERDTRTRAEKARLEEADRETKAVLDKHQAELRAEREAIARKDADLAKERYHFALQRDELIEQQRLVAEKAAAELRAQREVFQRHDV